MHAIHKSPEESKRLGRSLRDMRKASGLTLQRVAEATKINVGQLSRFENGDFVFISKNLQNFIEFLQNKHTSVSIQSDLSTRFAVLLEKSERHYAAATAVITALESLD
jgi:transcriptional regulator with XRE-family HTH domain